MIPQKTVNALSAIAILSSFSRHAPAGRKKKAAPPGPPYNLGLPAPPARAPRLCN